MLAREIFCPSKHVIPDKVILLEDLIPIHHLRIHVQSYGSNSP